MTADRIACKVLTPNAIAVTFPQRPDRVSEAMSEAAEAMEERAAERGRTISEPPRLMSMRPTALGFVELTFESETRPK
ncbi:MAG: hypothetical protein M0R06_02090 [Sphaerochaeta sp.]|jgi:hypothetical protein|nr:hypothetical protein [Sphaerochaeta sp.]